MTTKKRPWRGAYCIASFRGKAAESRAVNFVKKINSSN
jgi:hypothetical protein